MLKNVIAPIQAWLLARGQCVGCGTPLDKGTKSKRDAETEKITPDEELLKKEVARIKKAHPDADHNRVIMHVATQLVNEKVLAMLEG